MRHYRSVTSPTPFLRAIRLAVPGYACACLPHAAYGGQGLLFENSTAFCYGGFVWLLFHLFVVVYGELALRASFGVDYETYYA